MAIVKITDVSKGLVAPILRVYAVQELLEAARSPEMSVNINLPNGVTSQKTCIFIHTVARTYNIAWDNVTVKTVRSRRK